MNNNLVVNGGQFKSLSGISRFLVYAPKSLKSVYFIGLLTILIAIVQCPYVKSDTYHDNLNRSDFLQSVDINDWKTYRNEQHNFQISYPERGQIADWANQGELIYFYFPNFDIIIHVSSSSKVYNPNSNGYVPLQESSQKISEVRFDNTHHPITSYVAYTGHQSWSEGLNFITSNKDKYYIFTLEKQFISKSEVRQETVVNSHLERLKDLNRQPVEIFWQIISTLKFLDNL